MNVQFRPLLLEPILVATTLALAACGSDEPPSAVTTAPTVNLPPIARAGDDRSVDERTAVTLDGSASTDPDGGIATLSWIQQSGPAVVLKNADTARPDFSAPVTAAPLILAFRLTVTDNEGASGVDDVSITVQPVNDPPVTVADSATTVQNTPVTIAILANDSDPDGAADLDPASLAFNDAVNGAVARDGDKAVFTPATDFTGSASFRYTVKDGGGLESNAATVTVAVTLPPVPVPVGSCAPDNRGWESFAGFIGSMHQHSGYSDGAVGTTPADYFAQGKSLGMDFMGSAEHSDNAEAPLTVNQGCASPRLPECVTPLPSPQNPAAPLTKWELTLQQAHDASDANFTAFRGFEWTSDRFGHINVFFSRNDWNAKTTEGYAASMESFWTWFTTAPETLGGKDGLAVFNHPGREDAIEDVIHEVTPDPAYAFNDFEFRLGTGLRVVGIELFGKSNQVYETGNGAPPKGWYAHALDKGWHVGAIGSEDEHGREWTRPSRAKTVLIARDRSAAALREALLARRFYALAQNHNDLRLSFTADGLPMGARLSRAPGAAVPLMAEVSDAAFTGSLDLVGNGGELIATAPGAKLTYAVTAKGAERWYFVRVRDAGGQPIAYSSPVWINAGGVYPACAE